MAAATAGDGPTGTRRAVTVTRDGVSQRVTGTMPAVTAAWPTQGRRSHGPARAAVAAAARARRLNIAGVTVAGGRSSSS